MKMGEYAARLAPELKLIHDLAASRQKLGEHWLHGPWHWLKVARNAELLAKQTPGADATVAQIFGLLHDCERRTDGSDPQHGARAAAFARSLFEDGRLPLSVKQLKLLCVACERHELGEVSADPTIGVCWDADRLELPRVGVTPDPNLLSTTAGKNMLGQLSTRSRASQSTDADATTP
jgi:uncharacterized protein